MPSQHHRFTGPAGRTDAPPPLRGCTADRGLRREVEQRPEHETTEAEWRAGTEPGIAVVVVPSDAQFVAKCQEPDTTGRRRGPDVVPRQGVLDVAGAPEVAFVERRTDPVALVPCPS